MPLGQLGKVEASKPWTKDQQQPWRGVFEGVEVGGTTDRALGLLAACKTLAQQQSSINSAYARRRLAQRIVVSAAER